MSYIRPKFRHPELVKNKLGYTIDYYEGALSTLCAGCGHDSISAGIIQACYEMNIEPHKLANVSGIGCSSKTPAYVLSNSHGFNSVHGRMPSVATGANLANNDLIYLGVKQDSALQLKNDQLYTQYTDSIRDNEKALGQLNSKLTRQLIVKDPNNYAALYFLFITS